MVAEWAKDIFYLFNEKKKKEQTRNNWLQLHSYTYIILQYCMLYDKEKNVLVISFDGSFPLKTLYTYFHRTMRKRQIPT